MPSTEPMQNERIETAMSTALRLSSHPELSPHRRLAFDRVRQRHVLLGPESVLVLNPTGAAILEMCDGRRTVAEIVQELGRQYDRVVGDEVQDFLTRLVANRCVELDDD